MGSLVPRWGAASYDRLGAAIAWAIFGVALMAGIITRFVALSHYVDFQSDQVRDAAVIVQMRHGVWPALGPEISTNLYQLPPLYYYLVFPITLLGTGPTLQAVPNAIFSFLTIPLAGFTLYRLLDGVPEARRLLLSSAGSLWWSVSATDINLATREWNPSPVPFFLTAFTLVAATQLRRPVPDRIAVFSWSLLGALLALLVSLHGSTLYVMPAVFAAVSIAYVARSAAAARSRAALLVASACVVAGICLVPYWQGERKAHWRNSQAILSYVGSSNAATTPVKKLANAARAYAWLDGEAYFLGDSEPLRRFGLIFNIAVVPIALFTFRGNRTLFAVLGCTWLFFLIAAASYQASAIHYRLPIVIAPLIFTISSIAFANYRSTWGRAAAAVLGLGLVASIASNALMDAKQSALLYGTGRLIAVSDIAEALSRIPSGASVCDRDPDGYPADRYIDANVTHRRLKFSTDCAAGTYEILPRFRGGGASGSDFAIDMSDRIGSLKSVAPVEVRPPAGSRIVAGNAAFNLVLFQSPT